MIATNLASAAIKTAVDQAEKNKPTPAQAWRASRRAHLEELGHSGDPDAQYVLGQLYQMHRDGTAHYWMCQAANNGHSRAQVQMGHWYNEDRLVEDPWPFIGVRPNDHAAYVWYRLAERNGDSAGRPFREQLEESGLSSDELEAAKAMAASWAPGGCGLLASLTPEVKD